MATAHLLWSTVAGGRQELWPHTQPCDSVCGSDWFSEEGDTEVSQILRMSGDFSNGPQGRGEGFAKARKSKTRLGRNMQPLAHRGAEGEQLRLWRLWGLGAIIHPVVTWRLCQDGRRLDVHRCRQQRCLAWKSSSKGLELLAAGCAEVRRKMPRPRRPCERGISRTQAEPWPGQAVS